MNKKRQYTGIVTSDKMQKTITVSVATVSKHPKYDRIIKKHNKFKAHDEKNNAKIGDTVLIEGTRPLSKNKAFRLVKIVKKARENIEIKE